jgi:fluoride exporter
VKIFAIMLGGFFGAISRYALGEWIQSDNGFPVGTLLINLLGCFLLGWLLTFFSIQKKIRPEITLFLGTGFIGSFTTFSTFSVETILLIQGGLAIYSLLYVLVSVFFGLLLAYLGYKLALKLGKKGVAH